jgi:predicted nucleotide-binding protein (sugar kinase/HSP70/actin superfamily)
MSSGSARLFAAALRSVGLEAEATPPSDERTRELGAKCTDGDECYPMKVVLGDLLKQLEGPGVDGGKLAVFMPTADGPCRFGQYATHIKSVLAGSGYPGVAVLSPLTEKGYSDMEGLPAGFVRTAWRVLVSGDLLLKLLLRTRPYETTRGDADEAFEAGVEDLSATLAVAYPDPGEQMKALQAGLLRARERFRKLPARYDSGRPLIGIVGEIFCRLNTFSNEELVRRIEQLGGEAWMSDIAEWIWYCNAEEMHWVRLRGQRLTLNTLGARIRAWFQEKDEHRLRALFRDDFRGYEEPEDIEEILHLAEPYLPRWGALGEMVMSLGKSAYLARKGVDGIVDISPFTCMNGIVCEAIYPRLSRDYADIPIRNFYFDGTQSDLDRDLEIYLELARNYQSRKPWPRAYPSCFLVAR